MYLQPIHDIPKAQREHGRMYDRILELALESSEPNFKVNVPDIKPKSLYVGLYKRMKALNITNLNIHLIQNSVYLSKKRQTVV